jgi:DNA-binding transcriptional LysR family regulator
VIALINETAVKCFLTLGETLNFTEAAKLMYMTQQSVSKYIAKFEEDVGFKLFNRTHHYVRLTRAGEDFFELFSRFGREYEALSGEMLAYYSAVPNTLKLGYLEWLEISSIITDAWRSLTAENPLFKFMGERHPQFELIELFLARRLDMIITYMEFAPKLAGVLRMKVLDTPLVLLVSPENARAKPGATFEDFKREPFIKAAASHETLTESRARARRQCRELDFSPREFIISPNIESAYMATELGQGVLVSTMLSRMSLHSSLLSYPIGKTEELSCFWHEDIENPSVAKFAGLLERSSRRPESGEES